ncbi:MAG: murein biosynthesis integral membrane protein MurJ, partial [Candidatus Promineifilaceae bacterium]
QFGASNESDAFTAAAQLPEIMFAMLAGGALGAALIPVYSAYLTNHSHAEQMELTHTVMTLIIMASGALSLIGILAAPWLVRVVLAPDFSAELQILTAKLMRISLTSYLILGITGTLSPLLNAHQHFISPALAILMMDLGGIFGLAILAPRMGIEGASWGLVLGAVMTVLVQLPAAWRFGITFRPKLALHLSGIREIIKLMLPRMVTMGLGQAADLFVIRVGSQLPAGDLALYFFGILLISFPTSLFAWAVGGVILPTMSEQYHENESVKFKQTVTSAVRVLWFLLFPSALGLIALGRPGIAFLFERGEFDPSATSTLYLIVIVLALRILSEVFLTVLERLFFARHDTQTVMWGFVGWFVIYVGCAYLLVPRIGVLGLAAASSTAFMSLALALYWRQATLHQDLDRRAFGITLRRTIPAAFAMVTAVQALRLAGFVGTPFVLLAVVVGGLVYLLTYLGLGGREHLPMIASVWKD